MIKTIDIMTMLKAKHGNVSNRQLAKKIGISNTTINECFKGHSLHIDNALTLAQELGLDEREVIVGNLCEKHLVTQRARDILMGMIGEEYRPKIDPLSEILASMSADLNNEKKKEVA